MDVDPLLSIILPYINILILVLLLLSSALISGAEVSFFSLSKTTLISLGNEKDNTSKRIAALLSKPKQLLATILIVNNFINILIVLVFAYNSNVYFADLNYTVNLLGYQLGMRFIIEIGLITFLILLFGEVLPKIYASRNSLKFSKLIVTPISVLDSVLLFLSIPLLKMTNIVERRLNKKKGNISIETLSKALELSDKESDQSNSHKMLEDIIAFGSIETIQIMTPRMDVIAFSEKEKHIDIIKKIAENGHSRHPVYKDNIDDIIGVLYAKDLIIHLSKEEYNWTKLIRKPFFVPENKKIDDLLTDFKEKKNHLAIVVDEYGGTSGIVTLDDVLKEIVGNIDDNDEVSGVAYTKIDDHTYVFEGKTALIDFYKITDIEASVFEEKKGESETLAGFVLEISGRYPKAKEVITFDKYVFTIEVVNRKRIEQIKVLINK